MGRGRVLTSRLKGPHTSYKGFIACLAQLPSRAAEHAPGPCDDGAQGVERRGAAQARLQEQHLQTARASGRGGHRA